MAPAGAARANLKGKSGFAIGGAASLIGGYEE